MEWLISLSNLGGFIVFALFFVYFGLPKILDYLKSKDERHETRIDKLVTDAREERSQFLVSLREINTRLNTIDDKVDSLGNKIDLFNHNNVPT